MGASRGWVQGASRANVNGCTLRPRGERARDSHRTQKPRLLKTTAHADFRSSRARRVESLCNTTPAASLSPLPSPPSDTAAGSAILDCPACRRRRTASPRILCPFPLALFTGLTSC